jgi:hypothetical protein
VLANAEMGILDKEGVGLTGKFLLRKIPIPAAKNAGMGRTDLTYCFVMVQTTADFGVV